jgi:hypothetical protein
MLYRFRGNGLKGNLDSEDLWSPTLKCHKALCRDQPGWGITGDINETKEEIRS